MPTLKDNATRYRFAVPSADESVHKWLEAQLNLSVSLRLLIKEDIIRNGCTDVTCRAVEQQRRGRPSNAELEKRSEDVVAEPVVQERKPRKAKKQSADTKVFEEPMQSSEAVVEESSSAAMLTSMMSGSFKRQSGIDKSKLSDAAASLLD